ncbi:chorismate synthase [Hespellia stercorisuis]|uniref:Chorismate synthase n=1 Tax=Hespellia stercorisuis DSM 15480 TaxID=1121950 RepID=A0A1M6LX60_9FIRM|nr:chorismate synthase [Hespellia stercorisuis]SHJ75683.1 chorismate synthase [Hespellia stercorisuis DSM 15480]
MSGSTLGNSFRIMTWGESHGAGVGVVIDGCPAGLALSEADIQQFLNRRKPGQSRFATPRKESDCVEILSGVFEGITTGTPIALMVRNENQISKHYDDLASLYRPGHADFTFDRKFLHRDYRGGGRSSGRETIGRVAAGAIASKLLAELGIDILTFTKSIGPVEVPASAYCFDEITGNPLYMPSAEYARKAEAYLDELRMQQNSSGGSIECIVRNMPIGIGEPVFDKLDACLAKALMSIGAVKAVEVGDGAAVSTTTGIENNDAFTTADGKIVKNTNHSGGILGGMSDGSDLLLKVAVKPTPSISQVQQTVTKDGMPAELSIHGRHDPVIVPRAVVVVESMVALTLIDLLFENMSSRFDKIKQFYSEETS